MEYDNKTFLIIGLVIGGIASIYVHNTELASVIFGGLIGYLSHGVTSDKGNETDSDEALIE